jgi:hypothetical protein
MVVIASFTVELRTQNQNPNGEPNSEHEPRRQNQEV